MQSATESSMERAKSEIQSLFGGNIRIFTVNHADDLSAMDRVKSALNASAASDKLSRDIAAILKNATEQKCKIAENI